MNVSAIGPYGSSLQTFAYQATRSDPAQSSNANSAVRGGPSSTAPPNDWALPPSDDVTTALLSQLSARSPSIEVLSGLVAEAETRANSAPANTTATEATPLSNTSPLFDPADVDGDGIVTLMEQLSYDMTHPGMIDLGGA